jgi:hypothetical protein
VDGQLGVAGLAGPEVQQSRKEYDRAYQARGKHIADIVAGNACASFGSGSFSWSLGAMFGHEVVTSPDQPVRHRCVPNSLVTGFKIVVAASVRWIGNTLPCAQSQRRPKKRPQSRIRRQGAFRPNHSREREGVNPMTGISWHLGSPPERQRGNRLLLIACPIGGNLDAAADNRLDIYVGYFSDAYDDYVPARIWGMSASEARPRLLVRYWAEIDLPPNMELRSLTIADLKG